MYINDGRFGEFIIKTMQKCDDAKMWQLYLHSQSDKSFNEWRELVTNTVSENNTDRLAMNDKQVTKLIYVAHDILKRFNPGRGET